MAYSAIVTRIHVRPHPKADRIQLGTCAGHQVVVGLETQDGELGVFFPTDGQLSEEMMLFNGLYSKSALDKLKIVYETDHRFGFFSEKRRVRAQSFRGEKSDGFWCPLSFLDWTGMEPALLIEGQEITALNGHEICTKYLTPATKRAQGKLGRRQRDNKCFPKHDVTRQFKYVSDTIPSNAVIYITEKLHGTSGRYGRVLDEIPVPWYGQVVNWAIGRDVWPTREYRYLNGSKNVILEKTSGEGYYGTNEFRYKAIEGVELHKGEVVYFEIVGYVGDRAIMDPQPIKEELKHLRKMYGEQMVYKYGLSQGESTIYVYKIIRMNEDGLGIDLTWPQVQARCRELGLKTVPQLAGPLALEMNYPDHWDDGVYYEDERMTHVFNLRKEVEGLTEGVSTLDNGHMREGCVLRVESDRGIDYIKNKSWNFGILEGYIKDSDTYVDTEEAS